VRVLIASGNLRLERSRKKFADLDEKPDVDLYLGYDRRKDLMRDLDSRRVRGLGSSRW
jgi:hypothetical protein